MARCSGKTKAGNQCRRPAVDGSKYCSMHPPDPKPGPRPQLGDWREQFGENTQTLIGLAIIGVIVLWSMTKGR
ncbi:MAG: hypothetical protein IH835_00760 [Proteobacteria bacterium]|nr:hypothetical protein [Pseudomonadota bacterium]